MALCITADGYREGERMRLEAINYASTSAQAVAVGVAILNAVDLIANYKKQRDIADRSTAIAEAQQKQVTDVYFPKELQFLAEFAQPEDVEAVEVLARRYAGRMVASVAGAFAPKLRELKCSMNRHCTSANKKAMQDMLLAKSFTMSNARALGRRIAYAEWQARNDVNFDRRVQAVGLGRGLIGQAASLLGSAGAGLAGASTDLFGGLNSALNAFSFAGQRNAEYANTRMSYEQWAKVYGNQGPEVNYTSSDTIYSNEGRNYPMSDSVNYETNGNMNNSIDLSSRPDALLGFQDQFGDPGHITNAAPPAILNPDQVAVYQATPAVPFIQNTDGSTIFS